MANRDLTIGSPGRVIRSYCLPLLGSVFFQQLYNLADSFVAGRFIGEDALAAVGNSYEITLIFLAFAIGCNTGYSVTVSRHFGAKNYDNVKTAISMSLISTAYIYAALLVVGAVFAVPIFERSILRQRFLTILLLIFKFISAVWSPFFSWEKINRSAGSQQGVEISRSHGWQ